MNKQEAYARVAQLLADSKAMTDEVWALAEEHGLLVGVREQNGHPEALDPKFYTIEDAEYKNWQGNTIKYKKRKFRTDLSNEEIKELAAAFDAAYPDEDWVREALENGGTWIEEQWVPSQYC
jgi:hypothetical protein